jgi:hypothetical protein
MIGVALEHRGSRVQLAELAERQDFTERILTRQPKRSRMDDPTPVPTPV